MNIDAEQFWKFTCTVYSQPEIQHVCLQLQDEFDQNINLLLFIPFILQHEKFLEKSTLDYLLSSIQGMDKKIKNFRILRRKLKGTNEIDYAEALAFELELEKQIQGLLIQHYHTKIATADSLAKGYELSIDEQLETYQQAFEYVFKLTVQHIHKESSPARLSAQFHLLVKRLSDLIGNLADET